MELQKKVDVSRKLGKKSLKMKKILDPKGIRRSTRLTRQPPLRINEVDLNDDIETDEVQDDIDLTPLDDEMVTI